MKSKFKIIYIIFISVIPEIIFRIPIPANISSSIGILTNIFYVFRGLYILVAVVFGWKLINKS